jgi:hypothetical protein
MAVEPRSTVVSLGSYALRAATEAPQYSDRQQHASRFVTAVAEPQRPAHPPKRNAAPIAISAGLPLRAARMQDEALTAFAAAIEAAVLPPRTPMIEESHVLHLPGGVGSRPRL